MTKPITLELFTETIHEIKRVKQLDDELSEVIKKFDDYNYDTVLASVLVDLIIKLLQDRFDTEDEELINWWIYETEFGTKFEHGNMQVEDKDVKMYTIENLYNALCENYDYEVE